MNIRGRSLPSALVFIAALLILIETLGFASLQPGYSHVANTISKLGETGAPHARLVAFGFFLPVGVLVWLALWLVHRQTPDVSLMLLALSCLGTGYALAAFFPCDPGAPSFGSWRTLVHNGLGCLDYAGTGTGFLLVARHFAGQKTSAPAAAFLVAGTLVLIGLSLLCLEPMRPLRGAVQRVTEVAQFTGVFFVCSWLSGQRNSAEQNRRNGARYGIR